MKTKSMFILAFIALFAVSCGGGDSTSGSSNNGGENGVISGQRVAGNYSAVKSAFVSKSFATGLGPEVGFVHVGSDFTGNNISVNANFQFTGGICLGFWNFGDCDNQQQQQSHPHAIYADQARILYAETSDSNSGTFKHLRTDSTFEDLVISRSDDNYKNMLNIDNTDQLVREPVVTKISIKVGDQNVDAFLMEYFYGEYGVVRSAARYIVAPNLPVAANPIAIFTGAYPSGRLVQITGKDVKIGSVMLHYLQATNISATGPTTFEIKDNINGATQVD